MRLDRLHILDIAQIVNAFEFEARHVQFAHAASRRENELAVRKFAPVAGEHALVLAVDLRHPRAPMRFHIGLLVEVLAFQLHAVIADLAGKELLAQGRALIGRVGLVAEKSDRPLEAFRAKALHGLRRRLARADDENVVRHLPPLPRRIHLYTDGLDMERAVPISVCHPGPL